MVWALPVAWKDANHVWTKFADPGPEGEIQVKSVQCPDHFDPFELNPTDNDRIVLLRDIYLGGIRLAQPGTWLRFIYGILSVILTLPACVIAADRGGTVLKLFVICVLVSFWVSILVRTFAWNVLLARFGPIALAIEGVLGPDAVPQMLYTRGAVVACMIQIMIPYATLMILPAARQVDRDVVLAAEVLGATPRQAFGKAYWPQIRYSVLSTWLLTFIVSMGFFVTPALLGGPKDRLIVMLMESQLHSFNIEMASANAFMLMLVMLVITGVVVRLTRLPFNRLVGDAGR